MNASLIQENDTPYNLPPEHWFFQHSLVRWLRSWAAWVQLDPSQSLRSVWCKCWSSRSAFSFPCWSDGQTSWAKEQQLKQNENLFLLSLRKLTEWRFWSSAYIYTLTETRQNWKFPFLEWVLVFPPPSDGYIKKIKTKQQCPFFAFFACAKKANQKVRNYFLVT